MGKENRQLVMVSEEPEYLLADATLKEVAWSVAGSNAGSASMAVR